MFKMLDTLKSIQLVIIKNQLKSNVVSKTTLKQFGIQGRCSLFSTVFVVRCIVNPIRKDDARSTKNALLFGRIAKRLRDKIRRKQAKTVEEKFVDFARRLNTPPQRRTANVIKRRVFTRFATIRQIFASNIKILELVSSGAR